MFPNPVKNVSAVKISVVRGKLMGKYNVSMYDLAGKLVQSKEMQLDFAISFMYSFGNLAAGKYLIKVLNTGNSETAILKFEKF